MVTLEYRTASILVRQAADKKADLPFRYTKGRGQLSQKISVRIPHPDQTCLIIGELSQRVTLPRMLLNEASAASSNGLLHVHQRRSFMNMIRIHGIAARRIITAMKSERVWPVSVDKSERHAVGRARY